MSTENEPKILGNLTIKTTRLPMIRMIRKNRITQTDAIPRASVSLRDRQISQVHKKNTMISHMPTISVMKSSQFSEINSSQGINKPKNRLAYLVLNKFKSILKVPNHSNNDESQQTTKKNFIYEQALEYQLKSRLRFLGLEREGFEDNGASDLYILQSKLKSFMAKANDIHGVFKSHNTLQLYMLAEDLFYQCQTLNIGVLTNCYVLFFVYLVHKLSKREKVAEATAVLYHNAKEWKFDSGLMVADYFTGLRFEEEMKRDLALKVYFRMLVLALTSNNYEYELKAYDLIGKQYYYMNDLKLCKYFHNRFVNADLEPDDSVYRNKKSRETLYHSDIEDMKPLFVDDLKDEDELLPKPKLTPSRIAEIRFVNAKITKLTIQQKKKMDLYQVISGQKKRFQSDRQYHTVHTKRTKSLLKNQNNIYLTHLSIDRNIKPISDREPLENSAEVEYCRTDDLSIDIDSSNPNSRSHLVDIESSIRLKPDNSRKKYRSSINSSSIADDRNSLYRPKVTHSMVKQMKAKKTLTNPDIVDLIKMLCKVENAISQAYNKISECNGLVKYLEEGLVVKANTDISVALKFKAKRQQRVMTLILSKSTLIEI